MIYGDDLVNLKDTFMKELANRNDLQIQISPNELLILTNEYSDLRDFLAGKNLTLEDNLRREKQAVAKLGPSAPLPASLNPRDVPQFVKSKLKKITNSPLTESSTNNFNLLDTLFNLQEEIVEDERQFLEQSVKIDNSPFYYPEWTADEHEVLICKAPAPGEVSAQEADALLMAMARQNKMNVVAPKIAQKICSNEVSTATFDIKNLSSVNPNFLSIIISIVNYDALNQTQVLKRIIYPHLDTLPFATPSGLLLVKLIFNGCRRAVLLQSAPSRGFTLTGEVFPEVILLALSRLYPNVEKANISLILYRLLGWIPDKVIIGDTGSCEGSFEKLKQSFRAGNLLLFFQENELYKPVLDFVVEGSNNSKKLSVLTLLDNPPRLGTRSWEEIYHRHHDENIFVSWNQTIYAYRKQIHFKAPVKCSNGYKVLPGFEAALKAQVVLTVLPHNQQTESRLVLEKHRSPRNVNYRIRIELCHFGGNRSSLMRNPIRVFDSVESVDELMAEILVFDKCPGVENYVMVVTLEPENPEELARLPADHAEPLTMTFNCFGDFELLELPFPQIAQSETAQLHFKPLAAAPDLHAASRDVVETLPSLTVNIAKAGSYEFRVVGHPDLSYFLYLFSSGQATVLTQAIKRTEKSEQSYLSFTTSLAEGSYVLKLGVTTKPDSNDSQLEDMVRVFEHQAEVQVIAYSPDVTRLPLAVPPKEKYFALQQPDKLGAAQGERRVISGQLNHENYFGANRNRVNCYQKFYKNPGAVFAVNDLTEVAATLSVVHNGSEQNYVALSLLAIEDDFTFKYIIEDENYLNNPRVQIGPVTLKPNRFGYLILVLNLKTQVLMNYELEIRSSLPLKYCRENKKSILNYEY